MKQKDFSLPKIFEKLAPAIPAQVFIEPEWGKSGQLLFPNGRRVYFNLASIDVNPMCGAQIATDKGYANSFMSEMGYPVIPKTKAFLEKEWAQKMDKPERDIDGAFRYAEEIGFPVVVKPNSGSKGVGVAFVYNKQEFYDATRAIFEIDRVMLVQKPVYGRNYRVVVLGEKVVFAYELTPLHVEGDGESTVLELLQKKLNQWKSSGWKINIKIDDPRTIAKLAHQDMTLSSVPVLGKQIGLLDCSNLSAGGQFGDVTDIHPLIQDFAVRLTKDMGLYLCGVDIIIDGDISEKPEQGNYWVVEVNASPDFGHYMQLGEKYEKKSEALYLDILQYLNK
jgi:D-alanine-D-alanine ligase-like ATP-grasp enzyme